MRRFRALPVLGLLAAALVSPAWPQAAPQAALERITADALKADVSFLASDLLEGRATPSRGLDVAAEYIASQFRRAGLEPAGDDGYFQTAEYFRVTPKMEGFVLAMNAGGKLHVVPAERVSVQNANAADLERAEAVKLVFGDDIAPEKVAGKVLLLEVSDWRGAFGAYARVMRQLRAAKPTAVVVVGPSVPFRRTRNLVSAEDAAGPPLLIAGEPELLKAIASGPVTVTLKLAEPQREPVKLKNIAGKLIGTDLKDSWVIVSAHYDHVGVRASGEGDRIMNGANDNASGTASMIETAFALEKAKPRRSILFIAWFGEEIGLLGSRYYVAHPLVPLEKTVANINLEQTGRTDDTSGPQIGRAGMTGYDFSEVGPLFAEAAASVGVTMVDDPKRTDEFFARSDNVSLAEAGIPAHTLGVAFEYSDYHRPGDHWDKLDYNNMEKITRMIAAGTLAIANRTEPPIWNLSNSKAERYARAAAELGVKSGAKRAEGAK